MYGISSDSFNYPSRVPILEIEDYSFTSFSWNGGIGPSIDIGIKGELGHLFEREFNTVKDVVDNYDLIYEMVKNLKMSPEINHFKNETSEHYLLIHSEKSLDQDPILNLLGIESLFEFAKTLKWNRDDSSYTTILRNDILDNEIIVNNVNSNNIRGRYYLYSRHPDSNVNELILDIYLWDGFWEGQNNSRNLQGIENFVDADTIYIFTENVDKIDFSLLEKLPKLRNLFIETPYQVRIDTASFKYFTEIPDLSKMKNLELVRLHCLSVSSLEGISEKMPANITSLQL